MRIAVLMSTYNGEKYLQEQIDSICGQNIDAQIDLWIRDDGSSDNTLDIIDKNSKRLNIYCFKNEDNLGPAKSFLYLLYNCGDYDYYSFCDQDDVWEEDKIKIAIDTIKNEKIPVIYYSNASLVDSNLKEIGSILYKKDPCTNIQTIFSVGNVLGCTMVFNNQLVKILRRGNFPDKIFMHDSYVAKVCLAIGGKIVYKSVSGIKYRQHDTNVLGVNNSLSNVIKNRLKNIFCRAEVGIAEEAAEVLKNYKDNIQHSSYEYIKKVACYRQNLLYRLMLVFSKKTKYISLNKSFTIRLSILFGNQ